LIKAFGNLGGRLVDRSNDDDSLFLSDPDYFLHDVWGCRGI